MSEASTNASTIRALAQFTVRNIEEDVKQRLKERALSNGTSLEAVVQNILRAAVLVKSLFVDDLGSRVLPFDSEAAAQAAILAAARQRAGRPVDMRDTQIASIVQARRAKLATRNVRHFQDLDVALVDPWG